MSEEYVGIGAVYCCRELAKGKMRLDQVKCIVPAADTDFHTEEQFVEWMFRREESYLQEVAREVWRAGKLLQLSQLGMNWNKWVPARSVSGEGWIHLDEFNS